jgi:hypothetical protein
MREGEDLMKRIDDYIERHSVRCVRGVSETKERFAARMARDLLQVVHSYRCEDGGEIIRSFPSQRSPLPESVALDIAGRVTGRRGVNRTQLVHEMLAYYNRYAGHSDQRDHHRDAVW